eukprot:m.261981 g.261981  ORF g.261981 m.261981 type:complete len:211 (+) comp44033_c0_seq1:156-788(+)
MATTSTADISKETKLEFDAKRTCLVVIDVQPEFWENPAISKDFPDFPGNVERAIGACRQGGVEVVHVRADYRMTHSAWIPQCDRMHGKSIKSEIPYDPATSKWLPFATPASDELIIAKPTWNATTNTELLTQLKQRGYDTILILGLITSACVQHSAHGLFEAGHRVILVQDACGDRGRARHDAAVFLYGNYMYELTNVEDVETCCKVVKK